MNWQPIETAPRDGESFLACRIEEYGSTAMRVVYYSEEGDFPWHVEDAGAGFNHHKLFFSHWMPLPEPPQIVPIVATERSYADRADGATTFDPELQFEKDNSL